MSSGFSHSTILAKLYKFWSTTVILSYLPNNSKICCLSESGFNICFISSHWVVSFFFYSLIFRLLCNFLLKDAQDVSGNKNWYNLRFSVNFHFHLARNWALFTVCYSCLCQKFHFTLFSLFTCFCLIIFSFASHF